MASDIGTKITLEGEAEFRKQITNITNQSKALASEMKAVESSFNEETSAQEKAAKKSEVLNKQIDVQKQKVALLTDMYQKSAVELGENDNKTLKYKDQLNKAQAALNGMQNELNATERSVDEYGNEIVEAEKGNEQFTQSVGALLGNEKLKEFFASAADKISEFAGKAVDAAKELDEGYDTIVTKTGATGDALEEMKGIANDVYGSMPVEMADVGAAVGEVNTRFKQSGDQLKTTSEQFLQFARINGTDVSDSIDSVDRVMKIFHVDASQTGNVLGLLTKAAQDSGITVESLTSQLDNNGATFAELGYSVQDAANLMAMFESNGVDTSSVMTALKKSITNAAKEGKDANSVLTDAEKRIKGASSETEALQIATEIFGTRGAVVMVNGLRDGRISLSQTEKSLESYANVVEDTYEATLSPWDKTKVAMNNLKTTASNLAGNALSQLVPAIEKITDVVKKVSDWFDKLSPGGKKVVGVLTAIGAGAAMLLPKVMSVVTTLKELKAASDLTKSIQGMGGEMKTASGSASALSQNIGLIGAAAGIAIGSILALAAANESLMLKNSELYASLSDIEGRASSLASEVKASASEIEGLSTSYHGQASEIDNLTSRLLELNGKQKLNASQQQEYRVIVEKLAAIYPDLNTEIDASTGKLKDQTQVTKENVEAMKQMAKTAAAQEGLQKAIQASTEASLKQREAMELMRETSRAFGADLPDDELIKAASGAKDMSGAMGTLMNATGGAVQINKELNNALYQSYQAYSTASQEVEDADALIAEYTNQIDAAAESTTANNAVTEEAAVVTDEYGNEVSQTADELAQKYAELYNSALESVTGAGNAFKEYALETEYSAADLNNALASQVQAFTNYNANVTAATSDTRYQSDANFRAIVDSIAAMGIDGAAQMQAFVDAMSGDDAQLTEILNNFGQAQQAKEQYAANMAQMQLQTDASVSGMVSTIDGAAVEMAEGGYNAGASVNTGYAQGAAETTGEVTSATGTLAGQADEAIGKLKGQSDKAKAQGKALAANIALGLLASVPKIAQALKSIQTPIQKLPTTISGYGSLYAAAGRMAIGSLATGISGSVGLVTSAVSQVQTAAKVTLNSSTYSTEGAKVPSGIASGISSNTSTVTTAANALKEKVKSSWKVDDFKSMGTMIDAGIAKGMNGSTFVVKAAAAKVAADAIKAAKDKLGISSPSKEFAWLGEMSVAGYVNAMKSGAGEIARAQQRVISLPDAASVGGRGVSNSYSNSYGDINVNVNGANVSDPAKLADMVADRINRQVLSRRAAFA